MVSTPSASGRTPAWRGFVALGGLGLALLAMPGTPLALVLVTIGAMLAAGLVRLQSGSGWNALALALILATVATSVWGTADPEVPLRATLYRSLYELRPALLAWALMLWLPAPPPGRDGAARAVGPGEAAPEPPVPPRPGLDPFSRPALAVLLGAAALVLVGSQLLLTAAEVSGATDEVLYRFQAALFREGRTRADLPEALVPFFAFVNTVPSAGAIHSQYPPGWPAVLAVFGSVGLEWWAPPAMGMAAVTGTLLLGRHVGGAWAGLLAGAALLLDLHFVRWTSGYFSHGMVAATLVWLAFCAARAERADGVAAWVWCLGAGALAGVAFAARPLTALALAVSIWIWMLVRNRHRRGYGLRLTAGMILGGVPPLLAFLAFNVATNGSPFELGYSAAHEGSHSLGFGLQTRMRYGLDGLAIVETFTATPGDALRRLALFTAILARTALPAGLAVPLVWFALRSGLRVRPVALVFLLLPAAYFFWSTVSYRSLSEVLPFVAVGLGLVLVHLRTRAPRWSAYAFVLLAAAPALTWPSEFAPFVRGADRWLPYRERIDALAAQGPTLVFVERGDAANEGLFEKLSLYNGTQRDGDVVVARDLGRRNVELMTLHPERRAYRIHWARDANVAGDVVLVPLCADGVTVCE